MNTNSFRIERSLGQEGNIKETLFDLQGLRALAVMLVLVFHLWPEFLPGGYIGVDIFFVLSGFLMTRIIFEEINKTNKLDITNFFSRRLKRLVPAAASVCFLVGFFSFLLPVTRLSEISIDLIASAFFVENWVLASRAVDYLARDNAPGPLQHYWSLGVEMQFYILWPFAIYSFFLLGKLLKTNLVRTVLTLIFFFTVIFYIVAIWVSYNNVSLAYFATHSRLWEFSIGGTLAVIPLRRLIPQKLQFFMGFIGIALILGTAFLITEDTIFPGWIAIIPCLGAVLFIVSGGSKSSIINNVFSIAPLRFLGDLSYSIYLIHWPLIIFWSVSFSSSYNELAKVIIIFLSIIFAWVNKLFIEDVFRKPLPNLTQKAKIYSMALAFTIASASIAIVPLFIITNIAKNSVISTKSNNINSALYPGATILTENIKVALPDVSPIPALINAKRDLTYAHSQKCHVHGGTAEVKSCEFGDINGNIHFIVVGDSHAAQFSSAFKILAELNGWRYTHMSKTQCPYMSQAVVLQTDKKPFNECLKYNDNVTKKILELSPDFILPFQFTRYMTPGSKSISDSFEEYEKGLISSWSTLIDKGIKVIPFKDIPYVESSPTECLAEKRTSCDLPIKGLLQRDPAISAAEKLNLNVIDLTNAICKTDVCPAVIGNVIVWRDTNHLTNTYVETMVPFLSRELKIVLNTDIRPD